MHLARALLAHPVQSGRCAHAGVNAKVRLASISTSLPLLALNALLVSGGMSARRRSLTFPARSFQTFQRSLISEVRRWALGLHHELMSWCLPIILSKHLGTLADRYILGGSRHAAFIVG